MKSKEQLDSKATYLADRAKELLDDGKRNKAIKSLVDGANIYETIAKSYGDKDAWKLVSENLISAAKLLLDDENFVSTARIQQRLANVALISNQFATSGDYYNISVKYALKERKPDPSLIMHGSAMFCFVAYLQAEYEKAMDFLKRILGMFDTSKQKNSQAYAISKSFFGTGFDKKMQKIPINEQMLGKEGFSADEIKIIKAAMSVRAFLEISRLAFQLEPSARQDGEYVASDEIVAKLVFSPSVDALLKSTATAMQVKDITVEKSNDLTIVSNFSLPVNFKDGEDAVLKETFKSYHAGDNEIGPLFVEFKVGDFLARKRVDSIKFTIQGRPVNLIINHEILQEPIVGKPFPIRIEIVNDSRGDASNLDVDVHIPEDQQLQPVRGTLTKKFHTMAGGESGSWEIQLIPEQEGTYNILVTLNYKDSNDEAAEPVTKEIQIDVKM